MALKRNLGHSSCSSLSAILDAGVTDRTVAKHERLLASGIMHANRLFHETMYDMLSDIPASVAAIADIDSFEGSAPRPLNLSFEIYSLRADATNSSTLQNKKVHVCEVYTKVGIPTTPGSSVSTIYLSQPGRLAT